MKDASLGGRFPVMCVTLMNPKTGGVFASFGAHPSFEVALERSLTELLQGRSFEGMNEMPAPTFNEFAITEHNNIVDHFIDSTGVISWKFFNRDSDYDFVHWDFKGTTREEFDYLMGIFKEMAKEVYIADHEELGASACRILVPGFSEIYLPEDLVWDNNNRALNFRHDILNIHSLDNKALMNLIERFEEEELDDYMPVSELIGIAFDEQDAWGRLTIGELKALSHIKLTHFDEAKNYVELFLTFNDSTPERRRFYQCVNVLLETKINEELKVESYQKALEMMYGEELVEEAIDLISNKTPFSGLIETNSELKNLKKHLDLIESYRKLQIKRKAYYNESIQSK